MLALLSCGEATPLSMSLRLYSPLGRWKMPDVLGDAVDVGPGEGATMPLAVLGVAPSSSSDAGLLWELVLSFPSTFLRDMLSTGPAALQM